MAPRQISGYFFEIISDLLKMPGKSGQTWKNQVKSTVPQKPWSAGSSEI